MVEDLKKNINISSKDKQKNTGKQVEALKEESHKSLKNTGKHNETSEVIGQHPGSKNGNRNNKENH